MAINPQHHFRNEQVLAEYLQDLMENDSDDEDFEYNLFILY